jgi:hypothetical protein
MAQGQNVGTIVTTGELLELNSSTAVLTSSSTFTGVGTDISAHASLTVACKTDKDGILYVDFSTDNVNWDDTLTYSVLADMSEIHRLTILRRYFRIRFTNTSTTSQTYFRLQCIGGNQTLLTSPLSYSIQQDADTVVVKNIDWDITVSEGKINGYSQVNVGGYNPNISVGTETLWNFGGIWSAMTTAATLRVFSSSSSDSTSGTGAKQVLITGVDANRALQTETITLSGTSIATTTNTWLGVNRVDVTSLGSSAVYASSNVGNITISAITYGVQGYIVAGEGITQQAIYHQPTDSNAYFKRFFLVVDKLAGGTQASVTVNIWLVLSTGVKILASGDRFDSGTRAFVDNQLYNHFILPAGSYIYLEATTDQNNTFIRSIIEGTKITI